MTQKKNKLIPLLVFLVLLVVLIGLPAGSWFYLDSGLEYRKAVEIETKAKSDFKETKVYHLLEEQNFSFLQTAKGKTWVFAKYDEEELDQLSKVKAQFKKVENFDVVLLKNNESPMVEKWNQLSVSSLENLPQIILVDEDSKLINEYEYTEDGFKKLVEHIAIVLPRKGEKDIKMRAPTNK